MTETPNPHIIDADTLTGEMRPIRRAVLALGSNLGERLATLQGAVNAIADTPDVWVTGISPVYETEPVGAPEGSEKFLNAIVLIDTTLAANRLLDRAQAIEDAFDRERTDVRNAPRTLDVDLIVVGDRRSHEDHLQLPHPRAAALRLPGRPRGVRGVEVGAERHGVVGVALQRRDAAVPRLGQGVLDRMCEQRMRAHLDEQRLLCARGGHRAGEADRVAQVGHPVFGVEHAGAVGGSAVGGDDDGDARLARGQTGECVAEVAEDRIDDGVV